jgi:hypothetical protein
MNQIPDTTSFALLAGEAGFDPIEERLRANVRATIEAVFEEELAGFLGRLRYSRGNGPQKGIATDTANGGSPAPSGRKRCGCRAPGLRTTPAR